MLLVSCLTSSARPAIKALGGSWHSQLGGYLIHYDASNPTPIELLTMSLANGVAWFQLYRDLPKTK